MDDVTLILTAWIRPYYLTRALASWSAVPEFTDLGRVVVALGSSPRERDQRELIDGWKYRADRDIEVWPDSPAAMKVRGEHRALGEAIGRAFAEGAGFVIASSEDVVVSDDVLRYFAWCRADRRVQDSDPLAICAHNAIGQGWHAWYDDSREDQTLVRIRENFNPWCWGTWPGPWGDTIEPRWDWDATTGEADTEHGWDWQMRRLAYEAPCVMPDASRALNIGEIEGVYAHEADYPKTRAQSFRARRGTVAYRLSDGPQDA